MLLRRLIPYLDSNAVRKAAANIQLLFGATASPLTQRVFWLRDDFSDNAVSVSNPRAATPGPGSWSVLDSGSKLRIANGRLSLIGGSNNGSTTAPDPVIYAPFERSAGRSLLLRFNQTSERLEAGWFVNPPTAGTGPGGLLNTQVALQTLTGGYLYAFDPLASTSQQIPGSLITGIDYDIAEVLRSVGGFLLLKPARHGGYQLGWVVSSGNAPNLHAALWPLGTPTAWTIENAYVKDLGAPFNTDYGLAVIHDTNIVQSIGANNVANGDFSNGLTGWLTNGTPATVEVVGGRAHIVADEFYEGIYTQADILLTQSTWLEFSFDMEVVTGSAGAFLSNVGGFIEASSGLTGSRSYSLLGTVSGLDNHRFLVVSDGPAEYYLDNVSVKPVTTHPVANATADGIFDVYFTLPSSPKAGQKVALVYRQKDTINYWSGFIRRNLTNTAWDAYIYSYAANGATIRLTSTNVGTPNGLRIIADGPLQDLYTLENGVWTKRGSQINVSYLLDEKKATVVHSAGFTVTAYDCWPRYSQAIDDALAPQTRVYDLDDRFYTPNLNPVGLRNCEPLGQITLIDSGTGSITISRSRLIWVATNPGTFSVLGFVSQAFARVPGRAMRYHLNTDNWTYHLAGWDNTNALRVAGANGLYYQDGPNAAIWEINTTIQVPGGQPTGNADIEMQHILRSSGYYVFIRGGALPDWSLVWVSSRGNQATMYGHFNNRSINGYMDYLKFYVVGAPFDTDYGPAIVNKTSFEQSLGSELLTNGDFSNGATGYIAINASPPNRNVTTVAPENLNGGGGEGALNVYGDDATTIIGLQLTGSNIVGGDIAEFSFDVTATSGAPWRVFLGGKSVFTGSVVNPYRIRARAGDAGYVGIGNNAAAVNVTSDNWSLKKLTKSIAHQSTPDAWHFLEFSPPANPKAGDEIDLIYRIQNPGDELNNCWVLRLIRNDANTDYNVILESIVDGAATIRTSANSVGATNALAVKVVGSKHDIYTRWTNDNTWYKRGSQVDLALFNSATGVNELHTSGFSAPTRLHSWAIDYTLDPEVLIDVSNPSQVVGPELLANGGFENWNSTVDASSWTESINGGSTVNRDGDAHSGAFALRIDTDASSNVAVLIQTVTGAPGPYEAGVWAKANVAGKSFRFETNVTSSTAHTLPSDAYREFKDIIFGNGVSQSMYLVRGLSASSSMYFDDYTVKSISQMPIQAGNPTGQFEVEFTLPASPIAGESLMLQYRMASKIDFLAARLRRDDNNVAWDLAVESYSGAARTLISQVVGVGNPTRIRVTVLGNHHVLETYENGRWTYRLAVNSSNFATAGGLSAVWNSGFSVSKLTWKKAIAYYNQFLEAM